MVSISKGTYTTAKGLEADNYHIKGSEDKALGFIGGLKKGLRLGEFSPEAYNRLAKGESPSGEKLVGEGVNGKHRTGPDVTFSPDKSVSLVWAFGTPEQKKAVEAAHNKSVMAVAKYIEKHLIAARVTVHGVTRNVHCGAMVAAHVNHHTTRALDPQLHTHLVVFNITKAPGDTGYRAISNELFFKSANQLMLIAAYENELYRNLRKAGFNVGLKDDRYAEIRGVPQNVIDNYSKRKEDIEAKIKELQEQYPSASRKSLQKTAVMGSRDAKIDYSMERLKEHWAEQNRAIGFDIEAMRRAVECKIKIEKSPAADKIVDRVIKSLTENHTVFTRHHVMVEALKLTQGHSIDALNEAFEQSKEIVGLGYHQFDRSSADQVYSTKTLVESEKYIDRTVLSLMEKRGKLVKDFYSHEFTNLTLNDDQRKAFEHIMKSRDGVIVVQGDAGSGKTTMLQMVAEYTKRAGYKVHGLAYQGKAVDVMEKKAGIPSMTVHSYLDPRNADRRAEMQKGKALYIVDEASMIGTIQGSEIIKDIEKNPDARVVFIGDVKQHQSIMAGRVFTELQKTLPVVSMTKILRQTDEKYRVIVEDFSAKKVKTGFEKLEKNGMIREIEDHKERVGAIVNAFMQKPDKTVILTNTNAVKTEINGMIREELKKAGKLDIDGQAVATQIKENINLTLAERSNIKNYRHTQAVDFYRAGNGFKTGETGIVMDVTETHVVIRTPMGIEKRFRPMDVAEQINVYQTAPREFSKGDRIQFLKNNRELGVKNGEYGTVTGVSGRELSIRKENGEKIEFSLNQYKNIDHGYATTNYKSQGMTAERVIANMETGLETGGQSFNSAYVAVTRGRKKLEIFTDNLVELRNQVQIEERKEIAKDYEIFRNKDFADTIEKQYGGKGKGYDDDHGLEMDRGRGFGFGK
ncbi:MAG: relaxase domain-containing protein [Brevinematales bacterium]|nr:relaxase domain-containing protein [Brevinematales bacterium]